MDNEVVTYEGVFDVIQKESSLIETFTAPDKVEKLYLFAPPEIQKWEDDKKEQFIRKTMMTIAHDEKLKDCFDSNEGKLSIMKAVTKTCSTGLELGGKHAYLVPQPRYIKTPGQKDRKVTEARHSIRAGGYFALLCGGSRPIFKDLRWGIVYDGDNCTVDEGLGEVSHQKNMDESGEFKGCWVQIVKKNGQKEAKYYNKKKIDFWRSFSKAPASMSGWSTAYDEMALQASIRHTCDKYEQARDLLVASIYDNENEDYQPEDKSGFDEINDMIEDEKELEKDSDWD